MLSSGERNSPEDIFLPQSTMPLYFLYNNWVTTGKPSQAIINLVNEITEAKPVLLQKFIRRYV